MVMCADKVGELSDERTEFDMYVHDTSKSIHRTQGYIVPVCRKLTERIK
jgi:hypothetical protein